MDKNSMNYFAILLTVFNMLKHYANILSLRVVCEATKLNTKLYKREGINYIQFTVSRHTSGKSNNSKKGEIQDVFNKYLVKNLRSNEILKPFLGCEPLYVSAVNTYNRDCLMFTVMIVDNESGAALVPVRYKRQNDLEYVPEMQEQLAMELLNLMDSHRVCGIKKPESIDDIVPIGYRTIGEDRLFGFQIEKSENHPLSIQEIVLIRNRTNDAIFRTVNDIFTDLYVYNGMPDAFETIYADHYLIMNGFHCSAVEDNGNNVRLTFIVEGGKNYE